MTIHWTVFGRGPHNADVAVIGEGPGETEANTGRPFSGRSGAEQNNYLRAAKVAPAGCYFTNLNKEFTIGNPDPTPEQIAKWGPFLDDEIAQLNPRFIITVGRYSTRWFLGDVDMEAVHGIPHEVKRGSATYIVIPTYHPAWGFHDEDARPIIFNDYIAAGLVINGNANAPKTVRDDFPEPVYVDVDCEYDPSADIIAIDTEGIPGDEWSIQISEERGTGLVFRRNSPYFARNIRALRRHIEVNQPLIILHNGMYDLEMCRGQGLDLFDATIFDTMYAAYLLRTEPQGLKALAYRWCGMKMRAYADIIDPISLEKQLAYLGEILARSPWPKPEPELEYSNDGTCRLKKPQPVERRAEAILNDYWSEKLDKDGNRTDPAKRWKKVNPQLRIMVERDLGPLPYGTLGDIPLDDAVYYAGRDPDATLRLYYKLIPILEQRGLLSLQQSGCEVIPIFEEMQSNGMLASRSYFEKLSADMWEVMCRLQSRISHRYFDDRPFNPASQDQVATLMRRRGLQGEKRTKTGKMSTAKKSVEHLRYEDDAMADVIDWREHQKIRDSFCEPILERIPHDCEMARVRCTIKNTRVASRRISASDPNLTAIPVRNELGLKVRDGYTAPDGCDLGSWDMSQIEMRYMAHVSRDPLLVRFFNEDRDVHAETASRIFGIPLADVKDLDHRYPAKRAGFGIITNIQGPGLLDQLRMFGCKGWTEDKCDDLIAEWLKVYKGVKQFMEDSKWQAQTKGYVRDVWGHYRYLPGAMVSTDRKVVGEAERAASSHRISAGAQGMLQQSMIWLKPYVRGLQQAGCHLKWLMQIHDEVILEFQEDLWETLDSLVLEALTEHSLKLIVPVKAKGSRAKSWGHLKG